MVDASTPHNPTESSPEQPAAVGTRDDIVPRIKHKNFLSTVADILVKDPESHRGNLPVTCPLVGDLIVSYAFDLPESYVMVNRGETERLGLTLDELHRTAVHNLEKRLPSVAAKQVGSMVIVQVGEDLEACMLLLDRFWEGMQAQLPGKLLVCAAHRSVLLFCSDEWPAGPSEMRAAAAEIQGEDPVHALSGQIMTWDKGAWSLYEFNE